MKQFLEYIPLFVLLIIAKMDERIIHIGSFQYEFGGFFSATEFMITTAILCYSVVFIIQRNLSRLQLFTLVAICIFGGLALYFRNDTFLKWKAPIVYWIFAVLLFGDQRYNSTTFLEGKFNQAADVPLFLAPKSVWQKINLYWSLFFLILGMTNLYIAFNFEYWIDFKVIGGLVTTLIMMIITIVFLWKYVNPEIEEKASSKEKS